MEDVTFSVTLLRVTPLHECFSLFLIVRMVQNRTKRLILTQFWPIFLFYTEENGNREKWYIIGLNFPWLILWKLLRNKKKKKMRMFKFYLRKKRPVTFKDCIVRNNYIAD